MACMYCADTAAFSLSPRPSGERVGERGHFMEPTRLLSPALLHCAEERESLPSQPVTFCCRAAHPAKHIVLRRSSPWRRLRSWVKVPPAALDGSRRNGPVPVAPQGGEGSKQSGHRTDGPE